MMMMAMIIMKLFFVGVITGTEHHAYRTFPDDESMITIMATTMKP